MKFIARAIRTLVTSYFLAAAFCAVVLLLSAAWEGLSSISPWVRWPAIAAAFLFIRGSKAFAVCAGAWAGAGMMSGLGDAVSPFFGEATGRLAVDGLAMCKLAAPYELVMGTLAALMLSESRLPTFIRNIEFVDQTAKREHLDRQARLNLEAEVRQAFLNRLKSWGLTQVQREAVMLVYRSKGEEAAIESAMTYNKFVQASKT